MKKNDLYLASAMVIIALVWFLTVKIFSDDGQLINIYKDNQLYEVHNLSENATYSVYDNDEEVMRLTVNDGVCNVVYASCPDKLCVHQKSISRNNETIICLPNRIAIEIAIDADNKQNNNISDDSEYDVIVY